MKKIGLMEVKQALRDARFRDSLPLEFRDDVVKYLTNPGCACNLPIYRRFLKEAKKELQAYYPGREIFNEEEEIKNLAENNWTVLNCHVDELEELLKKLPPGRKQLAMTRFENQVTVVINELDYVF